MADINALSASPLAADEARDAAALTAVAWQMHGELAAAGPVPRLCGRSAGQRQAAGVNGQVEVVLAHFS